MLLSCISPVLVFICNRGMPDAACGRQMDNKISYQGNKFLWSFQVNGMTSAGYDTQLRLRQRRDHRPGNRREFRIKLASNQQDGYARQWQSSEQGGLDTCASAAQALRQPTRSIAQA